MSRQSLPGGARLSGASGGGSPTEPSPATFEALRDLLRARTGIALSPQKVPMVQARLNKRLRALGLEGYDAYLSLLRRQPEGEEWTRFVNAMTTNLTSFFREAHHFEQLVRHLQAHPPGEEGIRVWSAGCSTGEEPYTLAMTLLQAFPQQRIQILATDLDSDVLDRGRTGIYPLDRLEGVSPAWRAFAFLRGRDRMGGQARIRPEIQRLVAFRRLNLLQDPWPPADSFEAIFCRNTMIYFEKPVQHRLVARFRVCLVPGGLFVVGHSEALLGTGLGFQSLGGTVYRRPEVDQ